MADSEDGDEDKEEINDGDEDETEEDNDEECLQASSFAKGLSGWLRRNPKEKVVKQFLEGDAEGKCGCCRASMPQHHGGQLHSRNEEDFEEFTEVISKNRRTFMKWLDPKRLQNAHPLQAALAQIHQDNAPKPPQVPVRYQHRRGIS